MAAVSSPAQPAIKQMSLMSALLSTRTGTFRAWNPQMRQPPSYDDNGALSPELPMMRVVELEGSQPLPGIRTLRSVSARRCR